MYRGWLGLLASLSPSCVWPHTPRAASFQLVVGSGSSPGPGGLGCHTASIYPETGIYPLLALFLAPTPRCWLACILRVGVLLGQEAFIL